MYHENIQKKKGEEKRKIHFLPHKRSEIGIGWQSIAWLEGFQTGRVSGTRPRYHRIAHRTGLPRNKRLRRCGNVGASKQVLFGPGKRPEARGEGRGGCPPPPFNLFYSGGIWPASEEGAGEKAGRRYYGYECL